MIRRAWYLITSDGHPGDFWWVWLMLAVLALSTLVLAL